MTLPFAFNALFSSGGDQCALTVFAFIECINSAQCSTLKHHYDACGERVKQQEADPDYKGYREDCVEECKFCAFHDVLYTKFPSQHSLLSYEFCSRNS